MKRRRIRRGRFGGCPLLGSDHSSGLRSKWGGWLFALSASGLGVLITFRQTILSGFDVIQGSYIDSRLNHLLLEHSWLWADSMGTRPLWDAPFFYPASNTFAYSDVLLSAAPIYWALRWAGMAPELSFQLWLMLSSILNFGVMLLLLRRGLKLSWLASVGGAYLFAFGAPRIAQVGHPQLLVHFWTPVAAFALIRWWTLSEGFVDPCGPDRPVEKNASLRLAIATGTAVMAAAAQFYGAFYLGWFLGFALCTGAGVALVLPSIRSDLLARGRVVWLHFLPWLVLGAISLLPLALPYLEVAAEVGTRSYWSAVNGLARPASWIDLGETSWVWGWLMEGPVFESLPREHEHTAAIGFLTLGVVLFGVVSTWAARWSRWMALTSLLLVAAVSIVHPSASPWRLVHLLVPGAAGIRTPVRMVLLLLVPAAVWWSFAAEAAERRSLALAAALLLGLMAEQVRRTATYDVQHFQSRVVRIVEALEPGCDAFYHSVRIPRQRPEDVWWGRYAERHLDAAWAALLAGIPTVNGYSGNSPVDWDLRENIVWKGEDPESVDVKLEAWADRSGLSSTRVCHIQLAEDG